MIDKTGPCTLCLIGGVCQTLGLLGMAFAEGDASSWFDLLLGSFLISGIGGTALMLQSLGR